MRNSHNRDNNQLSILSALYCDSDLVSPLIKPIEKAFVNEPCLGTGVNIIDCKHFDLNRYIEEAHGLDFNNKNINGPTVYINQDIPIIPPDCFNMDPSDIDSEIVGVRLYDILTKKPRLKKGFYQLDDKVKINKLALSHPVLHGKKIILFCTGIDTAIEKIWWLRNDIKLFDEIVNLGFYAVVGMNFSLFLGECPLAQLLNLNKSLLFCQELSFRGVNVIPHIYAVNDEQRFKWVQYLNNNTSIKTVAVNTQLQKDYRSKLETELTIATLLNNTEVTIITNGYKLGGTNVSHNDRLYNANQSKLKRRMILQNNRSKINLSFTS